MNYDSISSENILSEKENKASLQTWKKTAGFCYVLIIICGICSEVGIRDNLIDFTSVETTASNIQASPSSLRFSIILEMIMSCADVLVSVYFGFILIDGKADPALSLASSIFRLMQQAVIAMNLMNIFAASMLLDENFTLPIYSTFQSSEEGDQGVESYTPEKLAFLFLSLHKYGYLLALIFFGVSMALLGVLSLIYSVFPILISLICYLLVSPLYPQRTYYEFITGRRENTTIFMSPIVTYSSSVRVTDVRLITSPKILGWSLLLAGLGYVTDSLLYFLYEGYDGQISNWLMLPVFIAEFGLAGWLILDK